MNFENLDIAVLVPCLNESKTIAKVITDFKRELPNATHSESWRTQRRPRSWFHAGRVDLRCDRRQRCPASLGMRLLASRRRKRRCVRRHRRRRADQHPRPGELGASEGGPVAHRVG